ncbi:MAG: hypothetical protein AAF821_20330 [Cyanobacteria bacterium P01_D01_bin.156]
MSITLFNLETTVTNNQLIPPVLAHAGELHGRPDQPKVTTPPDNPQPETDNSKAESSQTEANVLTEVEPAPTTPPSIAAMPAGLGESLFTILIVLPWLLIALRTELNTRKNRS